ncbi:FAD-binding protein [Thermodesulfobacteriota bacterium]
MPVIISKENCKGCKLCVSACPYSAITLVDKIAILSDDCTHCGACIDTCQFEAISFDGAQKRIKMDTSPFSGIYVVIEQDNDIISNVSLELLGKAQKLVREFAHLKKKQTVTAILIGYELDNMVDPLIQYGSDHVIIVKNKHFRVYRTDIYSKTLTHIIKEKKPEILLFGATPQGRDLAPRVANRLQTGLTADCTALEICQDEGVLLQTRPAFGGNILATIVCKDHRPQMATVRPGVMKKLPRDPSRTGTIENMSIDLDESDFNTQVIGIIESATEHTNLEDSKIIVSGGRGVKGPKGFELLQALADELGAEVGASRSAVEAGWISPGHQVGQTGKTVRPDLYIACGISGAVQHLAGMEGSRHIISINKDKTAPITEIADINFTGDLFQIVPLLMEKIREYRKKSSQT